MHKIYLPEERLTQAHMSYFVKTILIIYDSQQSPGCFWLLPSGIDAIQS